MSGILTSDSTPGYGTIPTVAQNSEDVSTRLLDNRDEELSKNQEEDNHPAPALLQTCAIIISLSGISFSSTACTGLLTVCLPAIAQDLNLPDHLLLWPSSAYPLACGCFLLLSGSIADIIGDKLVNVTGSIALAIFVLANGLAGDGVQLIVFRIAQGLGASMTLPTGVSIITRSLPPGRHRNIAFSCLGVAQPLGFSLGLVMGGAVQAIGNWRLGYYVCAGILAAFIAMGLASIPPDKGVSMHSGVASLVTGIDWVGIFISSVCLGIISYTCTILTQDTALLWRVGTILPMVIALALAVAFPMWMQRQVRLGRPALIPNAIWANGGFVAISFTVFLAWASLQSSELLTSLFFQRVQLVPPVEASFQLLPNVITGFIINPATGLFVQHFTCYKLLAWVSIVATISPIVMALIDPGWSFWVASCWAVAIAPTSIDVLFTIAHMVITDVFPPNMHALAGAVFNTIAQLGTSLGMSTVAIVSSYATKASRFPDKESPDALLAGYRAAFWTCALLMLFTVGTSFGLRCVGKLGGTHKNSASL